MIEKKAFFAVLSLFLLFGQIKPAFAYEHKVMFMPADKIAEFVVQTKGAPRILMMYTSWCPYCRKILPKVMDIERIKPGSVIAISEDEDHAQFVKYISQYSDIPYMIILAKNTHSNNLKTHLQTQLGVQPWDGYPSFVLLDGENKIVAQGNFDENTLASFVFTGQLPQASQ